MGFYFQRSEERSAMEVLRFKCNCGHNEAKRIKVPRPSGALYETEFAACTGCGAMYHQPGDLYAVRAYIPEAPARDQRFGGSRRSAPAEMPAPPSPDSVPAADHS